MDNKEIVYDYLLNELQVKEQLADILYAKITTFQTCSKKMTCIECSFFIIYIIIF